MLNVHPFNAPGLFMAVLWTIFLIFVLALYQNLDVEYHYEMLRLKHVDQNYLVGRSVELSASFERVQNGRTKQEKPSQAARRWYFIEEASDERIPIHPITWNTYIDGTKPSIFNKIK